MKRSIVKVVFIALHYYLSGYSQYSSTTRSTYFSTRSTRLSTFSTRLSTRGILLLVVSVCSPVVLVWPFVCPLLVLLVPVCLFITDHQELQQPIITYTSYGFSVCNYSFANKIDILF